MKILILMLLLVLLTQDISCDDIILSKFHQNAYKIKDIRTSSISYNEKYFNYLEIKSFKYNRTTTAINCTANLKIDVEDKLELIVQAYKFLSNEYRRLAHRFQVNLKKCFDSDAFGLKRVRNCGNITEAYFKKDITYHYCNYVIDETHFPPLVPSGMYKVDLICLHLNEQISLLSVFFEIYTPIAYPKD